MTHLKRQKLISSMDIIGTALDIKLELNHYNAWLDYICNNI